MDFDALRHAADPSQLAPPEPLRSLDRATVLAAHCQLVQQERALDQAGQFRTRRLVVGGPSKAWSSAALESLKRANLVDSALRTDHSNKGEHTSTPSRAQSAADWYFWSHRQCARVSDYQRGCSDERGAVCGGGLRRRGGPCAAVQRPAKVVRQPTQRNIQDWFMLG